MMQQTNPQNPNNDVPVPNSPNDTVSAVQFSPTANFLCASSWNKDICIYEIAANGQTAPKAKVTHTHPVLCIDWSSDGSKVVSGGSDNQGKMWDLSTNQEITIAAHQAAIKSIHFVKDPATNNSLVITGSFDKTIKYWDMRSNQPVANIQLNERVYAMDVRHPVLTVATATVLENVVGQGGRTSQEKKNKIFVFDINNPQKIYRTIDSPLKYQHRAMQIFPDKTGFAVGSVEGRVAISHFEEKDVGKNFAFKCHRIENDIYAVNSIAFHPFGTFATAGSDGIYTYWDKDAKQRLKLFSQMPNSITAGCFNPAGTIYAYAIGYDWSKGVEYYQKKKEPCQIMLHPVQEIEIAKKKK